MSGPPPPPPGFVLEDEDTPPHGFQPIVKDDRSELRQGKPQSAWSKGWESVRQAIFGSPDREEAKAAGVGLQPTLSDMGSAGLAASAFFGGPQASAAVLGGVKGPVATAAKWVLRHPRAASAGVGALPGVLNQNPKEAVVGAAVGGVLGSSGQAVDAVRRAKELMAAGKNAEARVIMEALRRETAEAAPAVVATVEKAAPAAAKVASKAVPAASTAVDMGKAAVEKHRKLVEFAKEAARSNPKMGQKIWMQLDEAGEPVKLLTPDQAGAAARKGLKTTWIRNLWGSTAGAFSE